MIQLPRDYAVKCKILVKYKVTIRVSTGCWNWFEGIATTISIMY